MLRGMDGIGSLITVHARTVVNALRSTLPSRRSSVSDTQRLATTNRRRQLVKQAIVVVSEVASSNGQMANTRAITAEHPGRLTPESACGLAYPELDR